MRPRTRAKIAWLLTGLFVAICAPGDALHFLPGCGHAVEVPGGLWYFGLPAPEVDLSDAAVGATVRAPRPNPAPICGSEQCAICGHFSLAQSSAVAVVLLPAPAILADLPPLDLPPAPAILTQAFQSRAPPAA
jgi:hypothetical protein